VSRPLRLEHPGAVWHVTARGNEQREIFRDDVDRERWLGLLGDTVVLFTWRLHAYVLMGNHYHLVLETPVPSLSRGMRHLNGVYTQAFNRRHERVGHLFQGRFQSILVERESHLLELLRYVVLNPVRAGLVSFAPEWPWSSYRATAGDVPAPAWLDTAWSLAQFGGSQERYREFVGEGQGVLSDPWSNLRGQIYLGSDAFVEEVRGRAARRTRAPEIPRPQREAAPPSVDRVLPAVLDALKTTGPALARHPRMHGRERAILAYTLRQVAGASGTTIAQVLGVSAWRACALARAGERHCRGDARLGLGVKAALVDAKRQT
jgi:REP element-mobilizing transposase RayT